MQFTILITEQVGDIEVTHADMTVELKCDPAVAVTWASHGMMGIVDMCTESGDDELTTPLHAVVVSHVPESAIVKAGEAIAALHEISYAEASLLVQSIVVGEPFVVKQGITAAEAMDVSDVFRDLDCKASIT